MPVLTLVVAGAISVLVGGSFLGVAPKVLAARISRENRLARNAHAAWWSCLGVYLVVQGILTFVAAQDVPVETWYYWSRLLTIPLLCAGVWGISTYLLHLYTGNRVWAVALAFAYLLVAALFFFVTYGQAQPQFQTSPWVIGYDDTAPAYRLVYVLVGFPPIAASIAYLLLASRTQTLLQRYRILLGGSAILAYVGVGLVARLAAADLLIFVTLVPLGALTATAAILARYPPASWQTRLERPLMRPAQVADQRAQRRAAMDHRLRELL